MSRSNANLSGSAGGFWPAANSLRNCSPASSACTNSVRNAPSSGKTISPCTFVTSFGMTRFSSISRNSRVYSLSTSWVVLRPLRSESRISCARSAIVSDFAGVESRQFLDNLVEPQPGVFEPADRVFHLEMLIPLVVGDLDKKLGFGNDQHGEGRFFIRADAGAALDIEVGSVHRQLHAVAPAGVLARL